MSSGYTLLMAGSFSELPALLLHLRGSADETLEQVAKATKISKSSIQTYEQGAQPPFDRLEILLRHYGVENFFDLQNALDKMHGRERSVVAPGEVSKLERELERQRTIADMALERLERLKPPVKP